MRAFKNPFLFIIFLVVNSFINAQSEKLVLKNIDPNPYQELMTQEDIPLEMGSRIAFQTQEGSTGIMEVLDIDTKRFLKLRVMIGDEIGFRELILKRKYPYQLGESELRGYEKIRWGNLDLDTNDGQSSSDFENQLGQDFFIEGFPEPITLSSSPTDRVDWSEVTRPIQIIVPDSLGGYEVRNQRRERQNGFTLKSKNNCRFYEINHGRYRILSGVYEPISNSSFGDSPTIQNEDDDKIYYMAPIKDSGFGFYETKDRKKLEFVDMKISNDIGKSGLVFKGEDNRIYVLTDKYYSKSSLLNFQTDIICDSRVLTHPSGVFKADIPNIPQGLEHFYTRELKLEHIEENQVWIITQFGEKTFVGFGEFTRNQKNIKFSVAPVPWKREIANSFQKDDFEITFVTQNKFTAFRSETSGIMGLGETLEFQQGGLLCGWAEMHAHPMSYLGFGRKIFYGAPDIELTLPAGSHQCNGRATTANYVQEALGNCRDIHGGLDFWPLDDCYDQLRQITVSQADQSYSHSTEAHFMGAPFYPKWPNRHSLTHQQMYSSWLNNAYKGGLRTMVALSVNNLLLAKMANGDGPYDDKSVSDAQTEEMIRMAQNPRNSDWMEIAYNADDYERIIKEDKLAIILGIEIDQIGNWGVKNPPSEEEVVEEISRLYDQGIRYIFPVHLVDNAFGGAAVYDPLFNFANAHYNGQAFMLQNNPNVNLDFSDHDLVDSLEDLKDVAVVNFVVPTSGAAVGAAVHTVGKIHPILSGIVASLGLILSIIERDRLATLNGMISNFQTNNYSDIAIGHANSRGLTEIGKFAVVEMMKKGMIIDIDHMSEQALNDMKSLLDSLEVNYPLNAGHNGRRGSVLSAQEGDVITERNITGDHLLNLVFRSNGILGMGIAEQTPEDFIFNYLRNSFDDYPVAIGSDVNGFAKLPRQSEEIYPSNWHARNNLNKFSNGYRTWDYTMEGVAHYGLMYDFLYDVGLRNQKVYDDLFKNSESFYLMWKTCEYRSQFID